MNLFRSEEHARQWPHFDPASEGHIKPVAGIANVFSHRLMRERSQPDFYLRLRDLSRDFEAGVDAMGPEWAFWSTKRPG